MSLGCLGMDNERESLSLSLIGVFGSRNLSDK